MLIKNRFLNIVSLVISILCILLFLFLIFKSFFIVKDHFISVDGETYVNQIRVDEYTKDLANRLTNGCESEVCEVQRLLDFTTNIPYKINEGIAKSAKRVVEQNYGDCDDKSNLLISMLKTKGYEAYFVLIPRHIFVIVNLDSKIEKRALYIDKKRFYALESTAKNSKIGFNIENRVDKISAIIDPFENEKLKYSSLEFR